MVTKSNASDAIGKQISKKHEWLPEKVIGRTGLRPFDSSNNKGFHPGNIGLKYSREGVKETQALCNLPGNIDTNDCVTDKEWEVSIYFIVYKSTYHDSQ